MWDNLYQILNFSSTFDDYALANNFAETSMQLTEAEVVIEVLHKKEGTNVPGPPNYNPEIINSASQLLHTIA